MYVIWATDNYFEQKTFNDLEPGEAIIPVQWYNRGCKTFTLWGAKRLKRRLEKKGYVVRIEEEE